MLEGGPLTSAPPAFRCGFTFAGMHLSAAITDAWSERLFIRACRPMLDNAAPQIDAHVTRDERGELELRAYGERLRYDTGRLGAFGAAHRALHDCFSRFAAADPRALPLYGAFLAIGGLGVALLGPSTAGKSVLSLHAAMLGARFLGDELLLFYPGSGFGRALPRLPALREPALNFLPAAMRYAVERSGNAAHLPAGRFWYALEAQHLLGIAPDAAPHPLHAVVFLIRTPGKPRLFALQPHDLLSRICERAYRRPGSLRELALLRASLANVRAYELHLGEPAVAARLLTDAFA